MILDGKVALITGADGPIGSAIALRFAREGAVVVLNDIVSRHLDRVATEVVEVEGGRALIVLGDVTNRVHVERMVRETLDAYGRVDVLVNHAGDNEAAAAEGAALCADAIMPGMRDRNAGRVISTTFLGAVNGGAAAASQAAVVTLTRRLALEYAPCAVTVNCVAPGTTAIPAVPAVKDTIAELIPMGRLAAPREIAAVYAFLASDDAAYVTGQVLFVDGGFSLVA